MNKQPSRCLAALLGATFLSTAQASYAQDNEQQAEADKNLIAVEGDGTQASGMPIIVTGSRIPDDLRSVPGSVTIIDAVELAKQTKFTTNLGEILQNTIPGLGVSSSGSFSNFTQTLRGRKPAVFIDGIPATVPLRDGGRDLRVVSPGVLGRIEVIRGSTAIYGLGASGGLINYATREAGYGPTEFGTDISTSISLTHPSNSLNWSAEQSVVARSGKISFVGSAYYEQYNSLFDASGDRLPPDPQFQGGIADTDSYDLYGKVGFDITDSQKIFITSIYYKSKQATEYSAGLGVFGSIATPAVKVKPLGKDQFTSSTTSIVRYVNDAFIFGSKFDLSAYYNEYGARYSFFATPIFPPFGGQSQIESKRWGVRSDLNTPLNIGSRSGSVLWGVDYTHDKSEQKLTDGRQLVPQLVADSYAPFAQVEFAPTDWLNVRGGLRYDTTKISVDTFTTIAIFCEDATCANPTPDDLPGGVTVQGGKVSYSKLFGNFGIVTTPLQSGFLEGTSFYAGFSQGYSVGDFGRALRSTDAQSVADFDFQADTINSYELGIRGRYGSTEIQLAGFYSTSTFGSTLNNVTFENIRAPEKIWGVEFVLDSKPTDNWGWGTSISWVDGKTQDTDSGIWSPLDTSRIAPVKATFYVEHALSENWHARAQYLYSGRQNRFPGNPIEFGQADVEAFSLLDFSISGKVGPGMLTIAVNNVLNEKYFTQAAWVDALDDEFTAGTGATARISYSVRY